jgi:hypothetical protein
MHTRSRAAATTALLLTASVTGLAATGSAADASGSHPGSAARAAPTLTVTITSTKSGPHLSLDKFRPGKTMFRVVRKNAGGIIEIVRFKHGYTIADLAADGPGLFSGDTDAVKRVDKNVEFYGGHGAAKKADPTAVFKFGMDIDRAATYYVVNLSKGKFTTFKTKGTHQRRSLPTPTGKLGMKGTESFAAPATDPHKGWMKTTNNATQPHFIDLSQVKKSTTDQQVQDFINGSGPPSFFKPGGGDVSTEVVSPGRTVIWKYKTHAGRYLAACFYPDKDTGTPHFFMGMFALVDLN